MAELKQYGVLVVGLLMAGGFAFGGMASYSSMINSNGANNNNQIEAELPSQNFMEGNYNLSVNERMYLTLREDVVFVSAIYNSTEQKQQLMNLQSFSGNFNDRVYISVVSASESESANSYAITNYPTVLVYGYKTSQEQVPARVTGELTESNVAATICSNMNQWGEIASYCASV